VATSSRRRVVILGAAGRDFHNFNTCFRDRSEVEVVAFTANQIPGISGRCYPAELAGRGYPGGIPIVDESDLEGLCQREAVDEVVFAYSDVTHEQVMHAAARALASGADFTLLGPNRTMLRTELPVVAVSAVRTGCGKSQVARWLTARFAKKGWRPSALRHPMPYGDLRDQVAQRFASRDDLEAAACTIEEREEYEPYIEMGAVVFAGVDYAEILRRAEAEADLIVWDGGNNDFPFIAPDLHIVLVDALRPDDIDSHYPGGTCLRMADVIVISKVDSAADGDVQRAAEAARAVNPAAPIIRAKSPVRLEDPEAVRGRRVLVVEDGPTISHGGMPYGAGYVAAARAGTSEIVDPRVSAPEELLAVFAQYPHIGNVLPAMGYGSDQIRALRETVLHSKADVVVAGTPIDLGALLDLDRPVVRARYEFEEGQQPGLGRVVDEFLESYRGKRSPTSAGR
jgi:predicted GTPase